MPSKEIKSTPYKDGFAMPAEFEPQKGVWMLLGVSDTWRMGGFPIRETEVEVAKAIAKSGTEVYIGVNAPYFIEAERLFEGMDNVSIFEMAYCCAWARDDGGITVKNRKTGEVRLVDFGFNAWGGGRENSTLDWPQDNLIPRKMGHYLNMDRYRTKYILEGGSICVDGEGTLITTESCLLNENRNPGMTREEIEATLKEYLGIEKVIWLKRGIDCGPGETDGHIDDVCHYIGPAEVVCGYTEDKNNPYYEVYKECYEALVNATDAKGRKLKVHKLIAADNIYISEEEAKYMLMKQSTYGPKDSPYLGVGDPGIPSYVNFLICNGTIIFPVYGLDTDEEAIRQLKEIVGTRYEVIPVNAREIAWGGGSIHCFTQQVSK